MFGIVFEFESFLCNNIQLFCHFGPVNIHVSDQLAFFSGESLDEEKGEERGERREKNFEQ